MRKIWLIAVAMLMLGCASVPIPSDLPMQVVGPENHAQVLDGVG